MENHYVALQSSTLLSPSPSNPVSPLPQLHNPTRSNASHLPHHTLMIGVQKTKREMEQNLPPVIGRISRKATTSLLLNTTKLLGLVFSGSLSSSVGTDCMRRS